MRIIYWAVWHYCFVNINFWFRLLFWDSSSIWKKYRKAGIWTARLLNRWNYGTVNESSVDTFEINWISDRFWWITSCYVSHQRIPPSVSLNSSYIKGSKSLKKTSSLNWSLGSMVLRGRTSLFTLLTWIGIKFLAHLSAEKISFPYEVFSKFAQGQNDLPK